MNVEEKTLIKESISRQQCINRSILMILSDIEVSGKLDFHNGYFGYQKSIKLVRRGNFNASFFKFTFTL